MIGEQPWTVLGSSIRGAAHRRRGIPNQDAIVVVPDGPEGPLAALADGHGGAPSFRSDVGASLAVRIGSETVSAFLAATAARSPHDLEPRARTVLPSTIVERWTRAILADVAARPFVDRELSENRLRSRPGDDHDLRKDPALAYGATLLIAAVIDGGMLLLQIGDGDILAVREAPSPVERPLPSDPRLRDNVTTSLCLPDARNDFRARVLDLRGSDAPEMILLTTDGYANSYVDEGAFLQAGPDILTMLRTRGVDWVADQMPDWLDRASSEGSGDDITMAVLWRSSSRRARGEDIEGTRGVQEQTTAFP